MGVRFILGRSAAGKTRRCVEQVADALRRSPEGPPLILLAPEQATFQLERLLVEAQEKGSQAISAGVGYHRARVLSFRRFARLVFNELGGPADPPIQPLARQMALRAVLEPMRDRLPTFAASFDRPGFLARLADLFREFHQYQVDSARLRERAGAEPRERLKRKLLELADAFDAFNAYLKDAHFPDPDAALTIAADRLAKSRLACGASVWVDGFAGFTPQELSFLVELAKVAEGVESALVCDPREDMEGDSPRGRLFRRTEQTYLRLRQLFADAGVTVEPSISLSAIHRFAASSPLATIEREMFNPLPLGEGRVRVRGNTPGVDRGPASNGDAPSPLPLSQGDKDWLLLVEAPDRRREVRAAANHVRHLVADRDYRYRDIAVILRSLDDYWQFIVEAFSDAGIPFFIDRRQPISHHPLVELLRSAVGAVVRRLHPNDVIAFLKTDLAAPPAGDLEKFRDAVDRLENYALAYGLAGPAWLSPGDWKFHESTAIGEEDLADREPPADLPAIIEVAGTGLAPLGEFYRMVVAAGGAMPVKAWAAALWRMLVALDVERTLEQWAAVDSPAAAAVHRQVFDAVTSLLKDLTVALGDRAMGSTEFAQVLEAGLSELTLGLVPPALDQVLVGAIERSRHPSIKAAIVLGLAERSFPKLHGVQAILTDEDRENLKSDFGFRISDFGLKDEGGATPPSQSAIRNPQSAIELAPSRTELLFDEDLMAYLALTRPSEHLWVSYPLADEAGKPINSSRYFRRLTELFPQVPVVRLADQHPAVSAVTVSELAGSLAGRFAISPPTPLDALLYETARLADAALLTRAMRSLVYENKPTLSPPLAKKLFAPRGAIFGSVTRLETFATCPFKHMANFGLKLAPREQIELDALQLGRLYHELLHEMYDRLSGPEHQPVNWASRPVADLRAIVGELVTAARDRLALPALASGAAGYLFAQAEQVLGDLAEAMHAAAEASPSVRQVAAELVFGLGDDAILPPLRLPLDSGSQLVLRGKIDRVDVSADGAAAVIDYKTSRTTINWSEVHHGLSLQLLAYLLELDQHGRLLTPLPLGEGAPSEVEGRVRVRDNTPSVYPAGAFFQQITSPPAPSDPPASDAAPPDPRDLMAGYQRQGLFRADLGPVLDARLPPGEKSPFVRLKLNKDGSPATLGVDCVSSEQLAGLMSLAAGWMKRHGEGIVSGCVDVAPYRLGNDSPCGWCDCRSVCRMDFSYNLPRYLQPCGRKRVLEEVVNPAAESTSG
ncbi:MAG: PD-(D/E)XK nuclease family protein [Phycisphaerae bacterium]|nr:PD-(D/E)XK nuclease family protein [Phycisphaerae bacterium]